MQIDDNKYATGAITVGAFVECACSVQAELRDTATSNGEYLFVFEDSDAVRTAVDDFFRGGKIEAREYSRRIAVLRSRCRAKREDERRSKGGAAGVNRFTGNSENES